MTMQQIFDLEANLSPSHVLSIRNSLPPNATAVSQCTGRGNSGIDGSNDEPQKLKTIAPGGLILHSPPERSLTQPFRKGTQNYDTKQLFSTIPPAGTFSDRHCID